MTERIVGFDYLNSRSLAIVSQEDMTNSQEVDFIKELVKEYKENHFISYFMVENCICFRDSKGAVLQIIGDCSPIWDLIIEMEEDYFQNRCLFFLQKKEKVRRYKLKCFPWTRENATFFNQNKEQDTITFSFLSHDKMLTVRGRQFLSMFLDSVLMLNEHSVILKRLFRRDTITKEIQFKGMFVLKKGNIHILFPIVLLPYIREALGIKLKETYEVLETLAYFEELEEDRQEMKKKLKLINGGIYERKNDNGQFNQLL